MILNGQEVDESGFPVINSSEIEPLDATGSLNFDGIAPCFFSQTIPIPTTFYSHFGFSIKGPNAKSGGAVLNECSNFGVTGYSSPNFLAFNCISTLATGGVPFLPETISFKPPVSGVSLKIGGGSTVGQSVRITPKGSKDVGFVDVILASAVTTVNFISTKSNIKSVVITLPPGSTACSFVIDDITTTP
jgi:hypothetical protein